VLETGAGASLVLKVEDDGITVLGCKLIGAFVLEAGKFGVDEGCIVVP
jgi:hypothetical protein